MALSGFAGGLAGGAVVNIIIKATDQYSKGFKQATTGLDKLGKAAGIASKVIAVGLVGALSLGVKNAADEEKALAKLSQQMKNHGELTTENIDKLRGLAYELQRVTGFADDQIIAGQAMLSSFSLTTKQVEELTPKLLDLAVMSENATGQQADLATVAKMVGVALSGQAGRLVQMGIKVSEADKELLKLADDQEKINILMRVFEENAGGLATAVGTTLNGKIKILKASLGDLTQSLAEDGGLLDVLTKIVDKAQDAADAFNKLSPEQKKMALGGAVAGTAALGGVSLALKLRGQTAGTPMYVKDVGVGSIGKGTGGAALLTGKTALSSIIATVASSGALAAALPALAFKVLDKPLGITKSSEDYKLRTTDFKKPTAVLEQEAAAKEAVFKPGQVLGFGSVEKSLTTRETEIEPEIRAKQELSTLNNEQLQELKDVMDTERTRTELLEESRKQLEENGYVTTETTFAVEENSRALATEREEARAAGISLMDFNSTIKDFALSTLQAEENLSKAKTLSSSSNGYAKTGAEAFAINASAIDRAERAASKSSSGGTMEELGVDEFGNRITSNQVAVGTAQSKYGGGTTTIMMLADSRNIEQNIGADLASQTGVSG